MKGQRMTFNETTFSGDDGFTGMVEFMRASICVAIVVPRDGSIDTTLAAQIGAAVFLSKPIILAVHRGAEVPIKLVALSDRIIDLSGNAAEDGAALAAAAQALGGGR